MVLKMKSSAFKALLLTALLMPLTALAITSPAWYIDDERGVILKDNADGETIPFPSGVAIGGFPGMRTLEFTNYSGTIGSIVLTNDVTITFSGVSKIVSENGIVSSYDITMRGAQYAKLEITASADCGITASKLAVEYGEIVVAGGTCGIEVSYPLDMRSGLLIAKGGDRALANDYEVPQGRKYKTSESGEEIIADENEVIGSDIKYFELHGFEPIPTVNLYVRAPITNAAISPPTLDANALFYADYHKWYEDGNEFEGATFETGKIYTITIRLQALPGWIFSNSTKFVNINNTSVPVKGNHGVYMELEYTFGKTSTIAITINGKNIEDFGDTIKFPLPASSSDCFANSVNIGVTTDQDTEIMLSGQTKKQTINIDRQLHSYGDNIFSMHLISEDDTTDYIFVINRPIRFEDIVKQKWGRVLAVKNNAKETDSLYFTKFQWFKNDKPLANGTRQVYYDPSEQLSSSDKYSVNMYVITEDSKGNKDVMEVRSCPGKLIDQTPAIPAQTQILGINGKAAPQGSKVYNTKGERTTGKTPGVYIIRRPSK